jgi:F-type H+-transporting ATPase subunit delta
MRDLLRGYATAALESAALAGDARLVVTDLSGFSRAFLESDPLRNVLTDPAIPARARRGVVHDLLEGKAAAESQALLSWAALVEPALEFPLVVPALLELAEQTADAADAGRQLFVPPEELLGGRSAVRERIRGYADRLFQEVDRLERIDDIEDELFRFAKIVDANRGLRQALGDPSFAVARRVGLVEDLLREKVQPATRRLVAYVLKAGHVRDLVGTFEWLAELAAEERGRRVAEVRSAGELDDSERTRLAAALQRTVGHPVEVRVQIDASVIGGMTVAIGDTVIDGSVRHRLDQLRETLAPSSGMALTDRPATAHNGS